MTITVTDPDLVPALDRLPSNGAMMPYHGQVIDRVLDLTADGGPVITVSNDVSQQLHHAWLTTHANANRTLPARSSGQISADASIGRLALDYVRNPCGIFGGVMGGSLANLYRTTGQAFTANGLGVQTVIYVDSRGYPWRATVALTLDQTTDTIAGSVTFRPFLHVGDKYLAGETLPIVETVSVTPAGQSAAVDKTTRALFLMDQTEGGDRSLYTTALSWGVGVWEVEIGDTIDESGGDYPYGGGTIEFDVSVHVRKDYDAMVGAIAYSDDGISNHTYSVMVRDTPTGPHYLLDKATYLADPGSYTLMINADFWTDGTESRSIYVRDRITHANYDSDESIVYWSISLEYSASASSSVTAGGASNDIADCTATWLRESEARIDLILKKDGTQVDATFQEMFATFSGEVDGQNYDHEFSIAISTEHFTSGETVNDSGQWTSETSMGAVFNTLYGGAAGSLIRDKELIRYATALAGTPSTPGFIEQARQHAILSGDKLSWPVPLPRAGNRPESARSWIFPGGGFGLGAYDYPVIGWTRYGSNNLVGLVEQMATWAAGGPGNLEATISPASGDSVRLRTIFSPDGSQAPDTTKRPLARLISGFSWRFDTDGASGIPAVYDRHSEEWAVADWASTRWQNLTLI